MNYTVDSGLALDYLLGNQVVLLLVVRNIELLF